MVGWDNLRAGLSSRFDRWRICLFAFVAVYGVLLTIQLSANSMLWDEVTHFTGGLLLSRGQVASWVWTNSLYPPIYDIFTAFYYLIAGPSVFAGRLVAVTFCVLSTILIHEIARRLYDKTTAFLAAVFFSLMPGIIWISRLAMIETLLIFVFSLCLLFFYSWLSGGSERDRKISIGLFALGVAVKYQTLVIVPIIMLLSMFFWKRDYLKEQLKSCLRIPRLVVILVAGVIAGSVFLVLLSSGVLDVLFFAIQTGTAQKAVFSVRYPAPIFYLIEMTWFDDLIHPVSLLPYLLSLAGLGFMVYRRNHADKFLLLWFIVVYTVFTLIPNREWRYVTILFPVLAIAAATLLTTLMGKLHGIWRKTRQRPAKKWGAKALAALLLMFTVTGVFLSCTDAYSWVTKSQVEIPVEEAVNFAAQDLMSNQSIVVAFPLNRLNQQMIWYYLGVKDPALGYHQAWQYPWEAVDAYKPDFNTSTFISLCEERNAKNVLLYEFSGYQYFNSEINAQTVVTMLAETERFSLQSTFGTVPHRIFVFSFR